MASGSAKHACFGVQPATLTPQIAQQLGITRTSGVIVLADGKDLGSAEDFVAALRGVNLMIGCN